MNEEKVQHLLAGSKADESFKRALEMFFEGQETELIQYPAGSPRIKVARVLMKLLKEFPDEPITNVRVDGTSSCSGYAGLLVFNPNTVQVRFNWDCFWKAEQEGLRTWYGQPDQTKAAMAYGYQCFKAFERI